MFLGRRLGLWTGGVAAARPRIVFEGKWMMGINFERRRRRRKEGGNPIGGCGGATVNWRRSIAVLVVNGRGVGKGTTGHFLGKVFLFLSVYSGLSARALKGQIGSGSNPNWVSRCLPVWKVYLEYFILYLIIFLELMRDQFYFKNQLFVIINLLNKYQN